jgi:hypothetical protein
MEEGVLGFDGGSVCLVLDEGGMTKEGPLILSGTMWSGCRKRVSHGYEQCI